MILDFWYGFANFTFSRCLATLAISYCFYYSFLTIYVFSNIMLMFCLFKRYSLVTNNSLWIFAENEYFLVLQVPDILVCPDFTENFSFWQTRSASLQQPLRKPRWTKCCSSLESQSAATGMGTANQDSTCSTIAALGLKRRTENKKSLTDKHVTGLDVPTCTRLQTADQLKNKTDSSTLVYSVYLSIRQSWGGSSRYTQAHWLRLQDYCLHGTQIQKHQGR